MEQIYERRADADGTAQWLVQRAIGGVGHCDFTVAEQARARARRFCYARRFPTLSLPP